MQPQGEMHQETASSKHTKGLAQSENSNMLPSVLGGDMLPAVFLGMAEAGLSDVAFPGQVCL